MGLDWPAVWSFLPSKDGMRSVSQEAGFSDLRGSAELFQYKSGEPYLPGLSLWWLRPVDSSSCTLLPTPLPCQGLKASGRPS